MNEYVEFETMLITKKSNIIIKNKTYYWNESDIKQLVLQFKLIFS